MIHAKRIITDEQRRRNNEAQNRRRAKNPEHVREITRLCERRRRMRKYGLTEEDFLKMLENQKGLCAICSNPVSDIDRNLHIDHCHTALKARGILCKLCNPMLGYARDDIKILKKAISYLERSN